MPHPRFYLRCAIAVLVATTLFAAGFGQVPRPPAPTPFPSSTLVMTVTDENGVVVPYAWVFLQSSPAATPLRCETDFAGHCEFRNLVPGTGASLSTKLIISATKWIAGKNEKAAGTFFLIAGRRQCLR